MQLGPLIIFIISLSSSCTLKRKTAEFVKYKYCRDKGITNEEECQREFKRYLKAMNPAPNLSREETNDEYR